MLERLEVRILLRESDFLTAGPWGRQGGAYLSSQSKPFSPSRNHRWHVGLARMFEGVLRTELFIQVYAGGGGWGRWNQQGLLENCVPLSHGVNIPGSCCGSQALVTWADSPPQPWGHHFPVIFLICNLLSMFLPLLIMLSLLPLYLKNLTNCSSPLQEASCTSRLR